VEPHRDRLDPLMTDASIVPAGVTLYSNVTLGEGHDLQPPCIVGKPPRGAAEGERLLAIGAGAVVRPFTTIYAGSVIGDRLQTGQGASIREDNRLGDDVSVGTNAVLEFGNHIGSRVRIHSGCFLELVTIEDDVFIGPNVVFTDDPHPMGCPRYEDCKGGPLVRRLARIGANSTILPGVEIGEGALVGAGSVVVRDVLAGAVVAGSPARVLKQVADLTCPPGWFERPYVWPPYQEPAPFDPGEACEEVIDHLRLPERYRPPEPD
jgi:acetyltransferase-like isoleucine patch superfamily enzyme